MTTLATGINYPLNPTETNFHDFLGIAIMYAVLMSLKTIRPKHLKRFRTP
jgi:hypothetical protein